LVGLHFNSYFGVLEYRRAPFCIRTLLLGNQETGTSLAVLVKRDIYIYIYCVTDREKLFNIEPSP
jgi:hypothetical protein